MVKGELNEGPGIRNPGRGWMTRWGNFNKRAGTIFVCYLSEELTRHSLIRVSTDIDSSGLHQGIYQ